MATAQPEKIESLKKLIKLQRQDTNLVRSYIELADLLEIRHEESMEFANKALKLAEKLNYKQGILSAKLWRARALSNSGDSADAHKEYSQIWKLIKSYPNEGILSDYYFGMASFYDRQNNFELSVKNYSTCIGLRTKELEKRTKTGNKSSIQSIQTALGTAYLNMGDAYDNASKSEQAIGFYKRAIEHLAASDQKRYLSIAYNNIGLAYSNTGDYKTAIKFHLDALKIKMEVHDTAGVAHTQHNIGNVYFNTGDYKTAQKNYYEALATALQNNNEKMIIMLYSNIGVTHQYLGEEEKALSSYQLSLQQAEKLNLFAEAASCYVNIGNILIMQGDALAQQGKTKEAKEKFKQGLDSYNIALKNQEKGANDQEMATLLINMGAANQRLRKFDDARKCLLRSLELTRKGNNVLEMSYAYGNLYELDTAMGNYRSALWNYKKYIMLRDSVNNEESSKKILALQMQSDFDRKETDTKIRQAKKDAESAQELKHQKQQRNLSLMGVGLFALMAIFIFRGYKQKQKANNLLEEKNVLIAAQKHLVEEKNKEITDSINYAKRLQKAILASENTMYSVFKESFILYRPKDIVSGDFYWILHIEDKPIKKNIFVFAAADCTGHGVPGAFMSMLNSTLLNQTAYNSNINTPADALNFLNLELPKNLRSANGSENIQDGMDIAFCLVDLNKNILKYAGANNPCWIVRNKQILQLKPLKQAITASNEYEKKKFVDQEIELQKGDSIYLFTDGYADQFGGPDGKKFKYKTLGDLLISINDQPLEKQKQLLEEHFLQWKGDLEQVDDVLVMGIKI
jgi:serine phosphatase RsbU (regulator of sigma subunit)/predicted negative regulator of RcsB-dependent stress response